VEKFLRRQQREASRGLGDGNEPLGRRTDAAKSGRRLSNLERKVPPARLVRIRSLVAALPRWARQVIHTSQKAGQKLPKKQHLDNTRHDSSAVSTRSSAGLDAS
jgi:hypothetical protein